MDGACSGVGGLVDRIAVDREIKYGKVLMTFDWAHQIGTYRSLWGKDLGVSPLPRLSETGQTPRPYIKSDLLAINARAGLAERTAAAEFLHFMISTEAQGELLRSDIQPARRDLKLDGTESYLVAARAFRDELIPQRPDPLDLRFDHIPVVQVLRRRPSEADAFRALAGIMDFFSHG